MSDPQPLAVQIAAHIRMTVYVRLADVDNFYAGKPVPLSLSPQEGIAYTGHPNLFELTDNPKSRHPHDKLVRLKS